MVSINPGFTRSAWLDLNRVKIHLTNRGGLDFLAGVGYGGGFWPDTTNFQGNVILFDFGPWVMGKLNGVPKMGISQWGTSYSPGPVIDGRPALLVQPDDSLRYRLYKIAKGDNADSNPDYRDWPVNLGAPLDRQGKPRVYGDQTVWTVFNNLDTTAVSGYSGYWRTHMPVPGLPVQIQQAVYSQKVPGTDSSALLANVAFIEWTIINVGDAPIESTYVSLWTDIDFDAAFNNRPAVDTVNQIGYCWQSSDNSYYTPPRAVGFVWLYGPSVPSYGSQAFFKGNPRAGYRNLPLSSFWGIQDDSYQDSSFRGPAYSMGTAWNIARGFDKAGNPVLDSVTHQETKFLYSGDPVTGSGWLCPHSSGGAGFNMFSGPFTLAPHDTQWVMAALIPVSNPDRFECIRLLRQYAATLRAMTYQSIVATSVSNETPSLPTRAELEQNYPNPFNPTTTIRYSVPSLMGRDGQVPGVSEVKLVVYDLLGREVSVLVNERKEAGIHEVKFDLSGLSSGVYFYQLHVRPLDSASGRASKGGAGVFVKTRKLLLLR